MNPDEKSKAYQRIKQRLVLFNLILTPALLFLTLVLPMNTTFVQWAAVAPNHYAQLSLYFFYFSLWMLVFDLPLSFYSGYWVEHQFDLSNQTLGAWGVDLLKRSVLSFIVSLGLIIALYALIWHQPESWWFWAWISFVAFSYGMGKIFPVLVVPMFYKYGRVEDQLLVQRILNLGIRYGLPIQNVYSINLSKTTKKANAAFMGMGKTKRVVLSDTLLQNFTADEIETVVAHELGHFKHGDIWKQLVMGTCFSGAAFYGASRSIDPLGEYFHLHGISNIGTLPVLFFIFYGIYCLLTPLQNALSRKMERAADLFSLSAFPKPAVFVSCMEKLARVNLADTDPHPLYEWFFYDHPAIRKRIDMAKKWNDHDGSGL
ncbi:MAG: M48 family peptidase [Candidatus Omnitrophica bacterium]|nr:M48 family peptidase [Candidatus Omnitrophota bacterium]